ncbi:MAG: ABC transporter substrate-binding protein [Peptococcaceae bacterium]|jgi:iron complex transport system substrate-binding protein|nr:ABC transporter substrate-binding protein [Peptococcaceae bacterium]
MKKNWFKYGMLLTVFVVLSGCSATSGVSSETDSSKAAGRTIVDISGTEMEIPAIVESVADGAAWHHEHVITLGGGNKITATNVTANARPWMFKIAPKLANAAFAFDMSGTKINTEELLKADPDIVFMTLGVDSLAQATTLGIPVIQVTDGGTVEGLKEEIRLTGFVLGAEEYKSAQAYVKYLDERAALIASRVSDIKPEDKPTVLHIANLDPLAVDGTDNIINEWIKLAGGVNVVDFAGMNKEVSIEQVMQWDPDIIIIGRILSNTSTSGTTVSNSSIDQVFGNSNWSGLTAVKERRVYENADGVFSWDRRAAEFVLQFQWAAKLLYPELFSDIDMVKEIKYYFNTFAHYSISDEDAQKMLTGQAPDLHE